MRSTGGESHANSGGRAPHCEATKKVMGGGTHAWDDCGAFQLLSIHAFKRAAGTAGRTARMGADV